VVVPGRSVGEDDSDSDSDINSTDEFNFAVNDNEFEQVCEKKIHSPRYISCLLYSVPVIGYFFLGE
jgi:hypothetical protein